MNITSSAEHRAQTTVGLTLAEVIPPMREEMNEIADAWYALFEGGAARESFADNLNPFALQVRALMHSLQIPPENADSSGCQNEQASNDQKDSPIGLHV